jgi:hypothetical protein
VLDAGLVERPVEGVYDLDGNALVVPAHQAEDRARELGRPLGRAR